MAQITKQEYDEAIDMLENGVALRSSAHIVMQYVEQLELTVQLYRLVVQEDNPETRQIILADFGEPFVLPSTMPEFAEFKDELSAFEESTIQSFYKNNLLIHSSDNEIQQQTINTIRESYRSFILSWKKHDDYEIKKADDDA